MSLVDSITVHAAQKQLIADSSVVLIDVRTPAEFQAEHATRAINLPLDTITATSTKLAAGGATQIYIICQSGKRSHSACEKLSTEGMKNLINIEGGTHAWIQASLPTIKGEDTTSIE